MENETQNDVIKENVTQDNVINTNTTNKTTDSKGLSIASMILGIVSLVLCCIWYISLPCAILAIIFGILGRKRAGKGMALAGFILGIISISLYVLLIVLGTATIMTFTAPFI